MGKKLGGVVGIWLDDHELVVAATKVREAGYKNSMRSRRFLCMAWKRPLELNVLLFLGLHSLRA